MLTLRIWIFILRRALAAFAEKYIKASASAILLNHLFPNIQRDRLALYKLKDTTTAGAGKV
jgi:hypothetical protein